MDKKRPELGTVQTPVTVLPWQSNVSWASLNGMGWVLMTLHSHFIHEFGYVYVQVIWLLQTIETHWMDKLPLLSYLHQEVKRVVKSKYTLNFWILYIRHENEGMSFICDKKSEQTEVARAILRWGKKWKSPWDGGGLKVAAPWSRPAGGRPPTGGQFALCRGLVWSETWKIGQKFLGFKSLLPFSWLCILAREGKIWADYNARYVLY